MKRWCYNCGGENEIDAAACADCDEALSRRAILPEAPKPRKAAPKPAKSASKAEEDTDLEPERESHDGLMRATSWATAFGVAVMGLVVVFFIGVAVMAYLR